MIFTLNFYEFLHTVYKCLLNSVVKISMMFARYFEYYTIILRGGAFFVDTLYFSSNFSFSCTIEYLAK